MIFEEMLKEEHAEGTMEGCKEVLFLFLKNLGDMKMKKIG